MDCINSNVTMSYEASNKVHVLDRIDAEELKMLVT